MTFTVQRSSFGAFYVATPSGLRFSGFYNDRALAQANADRLNKQAEEMTFPYERKN